jgi:hypothetical protein
MFAKQIDVFKLVVLCYRNFGSSRFEFERLESTKRLVLRSEIEVENVGDIIVARNRSEIEV